MAVAAPRSFGARARLGDHRFAEAFASGSTCSIDALLEDIDRATE